MAERTEDVSLLYGEAVSSCSPTLPRFAAMLGNTRNGGRTAKRFRPLFGVALAGRTLVGHTNLVDDKKIATQSLENNKPGEFFDVTYPLPEQLTKNKDKITVRFQAHPGNIAGGLYGLRAIKN